LRLPCGCIPLLSPSATGRSGHASDPVVAGAPPYSSGSCDERRWVGTVQLVGLSTSDSGLAVVGKRMRRWMVACAFIGAMVNVQPAAGQQELDQPQPDAGDSGEDIPVGQVPPLAPGLLQSAAHDGERAATEIQRRIAELHGARVALARGESAEAQRALDDATDRLVGLAASLQDQGARLDTLQFTHRQLVGDYLQARDRLARHVAVLYTANPDVAIANDLLRSGDLEAAMVRGLLIRSILDSGRRELLATHVAASSSDPDIEGLARQHAAAREGLAPLLDSEELAAHVVALAEDDVEAALSLAGTWIFPVAGDHDFVDSFLAPRMVGTRSAHRHQGADIFAEMGTPVVAVERGLIGRVGEVSLGGRRVWLVGESGTNYYYAHLSRFADGLESGQFVEAGTVLGYVGDSGNAVGTPPHLHFQVHPDGGRAVNPHALLLAGAVISS